MGKQLIDLNEVLDVLNKFRLEEWEKGPDERIGDGSPEVILQCMKRVKQVATTQCDVPAPTHCSCRFCSNCEV